MVIIIYKIQFLAIFAKTNTVFPFNYIGLIVFDHRFPFDRRTFPVGYLLSFSFEMMLLFYCCTIAAIFIQFLLGSALIVVAFVKDIKQDLRSLNESLKNGMDPIRFQKRFNSVIQFHSNTKELSGNLFFPQNLIRI